MGDADIWNAMGTVDFLRHKIEVLRQHCSDVGRDPGEITFTLGILRSGSDAFSGYSSGSRERSARSRGSSSRGGRSGGGGRRR